MVVSWNEGPRECLFVWLLFECKHSMGSTGNGRTLASAQVGAAPHYIHPKYCILLGLTLFAESAMSQCCCGNLFKRGLSIHQWKGIADYQENNEDLVANGFSCRVRACSSCWQISLQGTSLSALLFKGSFFFCWKGRGIFWVVYSSTCRRQSQNSCSWFGCFKYSWIFGNCSLPEPRSTSFSPPGFPPAASPARSACPASPAVRHCSCPRECFCQNAAVRLQQGEMSRSTKCYRSSTE